MASIASYAPDPLDAAWQSGNEDLLVAELRKVKGQRTSRRLRERRVGNILDRTGSARVRNAAALALADMHATGAEQALIALLRRDDTRGSRGTLLYALDQIGARVPLDCLASVLVHDSYEAGEGALALLAGAIAKYDKSERFAGATATGAVAGGRRQGAVPGDTQGAGTLAQSRGLSLRLAAPGAVSVV